jgi:DNA-binding NarL/FixJ family response regulator
VSGPASKAADAHRLAIEQELDLAVVDINLKGEMAYNLIDQLRDLGVRVVVVSGYAGAARANRKGRCRFAETVQRTGVARDLAPGAFVVTSQVEYVGPNTAEMACWPSFHTPCAPCKQ